MKGDVWLPSGRVVNMRNYAFVEFFEEKIMDEETTPAARITYPARIDENTGGCEIHLRGDDALAIRAYLNYEAERPPVINQTRRIE